MGQQRAVPGFGYAEVSNCACMLVCNVVFSDSIRFAVALGWCLAIDIPRLRGS